ncbi:hypothetical protein GCM10011571_31680 [Marinithermofilum abyssi]|uniref:Uncharacterized protein n=1 Tax=Marinithermofilum abyssi TaxID=1571185 RepID=A0A8J2VGV3_9BACL|nr:hypothetical protein [Marinithermofilum abyssi]GGE27128.1 hypothetical protein GCM10011571_31680 [Marinithermofilum abyssi]
MIRKAFSILGILLLSGVLINGITMTQHLKKIHAGLEDNLVSIQKLNQVQAAIIHKNEEINKMVSTVDNINKGLDQTIDRTNKTLALLTQVVDLNADSLRLNNDMIGYSSNSKNKISTLNQSLKELSPYMTQLDNMLKNLSKTAQEDQKHMNELLKSTESLNNKTPGVELGR